MMRAAKIAAAVALAIGGSAAEAQQKSPIQRIGPNSQSQSVAPTGTRIAPTVRESVIVRPTPQPAGPIGGGHGHHHGRNHRHGGRVFGPFGGGRGFGWSSWDSVGVYGPGFNYFHGPVYGGFPINPPVYVFPPFGYAPTFGYGSAFGPVGPPFLDEDLLQFQYENDWRVLSAKAADLALKNEGDPKPGMAAVPVPSTREAKIKSLRYQARGDEAFRNQDFVRAAGLYRQAFAAARDNGAAFFRLGYAQVATGQLSTALEYFKRGLVVEPALVLTGPTPGELYGPDNGLAWTAHLGRVTRWVAEDVRDSDRVFLLGLLLYYDGDTRATEFLERAWQLSGGTETAILPLLNPPQVDGVKELNQGEIAAPENDGPLPSDEAESALPELPELGAPADAEAPAARPDGMVPLFPLPSDQKADPDASALPPLPAPSAEESAPAPR